MQVVLWPLDRSMQLFGVANPFMSLQPLARASLLGGLGILLYFAVLLALRPAAWKEIKQVFARLCGTRESV
jgi:hypothetical protein